MNLFELLCDLKEKLHCRFEFQFNNKLEIMMVCILPAGHIFAMFIIRSDNP